MHGQGLFFRTPQESHVMRYIPGAGRTVPVPNDMKPAGLGFDFEEDPRRQSASDDSTVEIATPVTMRPIKGSHLSQSSDPASANRESFDLASPPPISSAFMTGSNDTSPASQQPDGADSDDGELCYLFRSRMRVTPVQNIPLVTRLSTLLSR